MRERTSVMVDLLQNDFTVLFSCVKSPWLSREWVGRRLSWEVLEEMQRICGEKGMDLCGEEGEYHTMVTDGPLYKKTLRLVSTQVEEKDPGLWFMRVHSIELDFKGALESKSI